MFTEQKDLRRKSSKHGADRRLFTGCFCGCALLNERSLNRTLSVISSFLLCSINGTTLTLGNLSVYTTSYFKARVDSGKASESNWILSLYIAGFGVGSLLSSVSGKKISKRLMCILASCLNVFGLIISYFSLNVSVYALSITLGSVCGVAGGAIVNVSLQLVYPWLHKGKGLVTSIVRTASAVNGFLMNYFVTLMINPGDEQPDVTASGLSYFSQETILDRVPYVFLYMGLINGFIMFIGCVLIREKKFEVPKSSDDKNIVQNQRDTNKNKTSYFSFSKSFNKFYLSKSNSMNDLSLNKLSEKMTLPQEGKENVKLNTFYSMKEIRSYHSSSDLFHVNGHTASSYEMKKQRTRSLTNLQNEPRKNTHLDRESSVCNIEISMEVDSVERSQVLLTYKELLTTKNFYVVYLILAIGTLHYNITLKYYKLIAQIWIQDDHFLTNLGIVMSISLVFTRPLWGYFIDKFGLKNVFIMTLSVSSCAFSWLYIVPATSRWLYCVVVYILWNTVNALPVLGPSVPVKLYGNANFTKAYGLQVMSIDLGTLLTPILLQLALEYVSWYAILSGIAFMGLIGLVFVITCFPKIAH